MYAYLVLELGLDPSWVLDKAEIYELDALLEFSYYKNKNDWERSRMQIMSTYQSQSTKKIDFSDFMQFDWENEVIEDDSPEPTDGTEFCTNCADIFWRFCLFTQISFRGIIYSDILWRWYYASIKSTAKSR